jgi:membrane protein YdbS with pleckstrin-like domain
MSDRDDPPESDAPEADNPATRAVDARHDGHASLVASIEDLDELMDEESVGERRRLDSRVRLYWVASRAVGAVVVTVLAAVTFRFVGGGAGLVDTPGTLPFGFARRTALVATGVFALVGGSSVVHAVLYYRSWRYEVRGDSLYLTRGVLTRVQTVAPYVRVQHIDARRGPVERILGLSTLVVYTAGSRGADVTVPGLTDDRADELQTALKRLAIESEEEGAV